jgi:hypothetical protein
MVTGANASVLWMAIVKPTFAQPRSCTTSRLPVRCRDCERSGAGPPSYGEGYDEGEQFNSSKPDNQQCKHNRVVFEPNTHDVHQ